MLDTLLEKCCCSADYLAILCKIHTFWLDRKRDLCGNSMIPVSLKLLAQAIGARTCNRDIVFFLICHLRPVFERSFEKHLKNKN